MTPEASSEGRLGFLDQVRGSAGDSSDLCAA
jgi:hypothetical protein